MVLGNIKIENAEIRFRNLTGKEGMYNAGGKRNFCVILNQEDAEKLSEEGWNVKWLKPSEDGDDSRPYISVEARFNNYPPKIMMIGAGGPVKLDEDSVHILDTADLETVDLIISPYQWETPDGKSGIKAYLKSGYFKLQVDEFEAKWLNAPESSSVATCPDCDRVDGSCVDCGKCVPM